MNTLKITPDLTWTSAGSTKTITYSINDYPGYSVTSWVSIDSVSGQLTINAPSVTSDTVYKFYVNSAVFDTQQSNPENDIVDGEFLKSCKLTDLKQLEFFCLISLSHQLQFELRYLSCFKQFFQAAQVLR